MREGGCVPHQWITLKKEAQLHKRRPFYFSTFWHDKCHVRACYRVCTAACEQEYERNIHVHQPCKQLCWNIIYFRIRAKTIILIVFVSCSAATGGSNEPMMNHSEVKKKPHKNTDLKEQRKGEIYALSEVFSNCIFQLYKRKHFSDEDNPAKAFSQSLSVGNIWEHVGCFTTTQT